MAPRAVAHGAAGIRETMAGYIGLKPHMDVIVHHTTVSGEFALCRSQWRITGTDKDGNPIEVHHHGMEVMRRLPSGRWVFFIDHPWERTLRGQWTGLPLRREARSAPGCASTQHGWAD